MANSTFRFSCPCCSKWIEVDTRSGKARAVRATEGRAGDLDTLLAAHSREGARLDDLFSGAAADEAKRADELEQKLRRAKEEAQKDTDEKPRNIFDLD